jgi:hypothetical protein
MVTIKVTNIRYLWIQVLIVALLFVAILVPFNFFQFARSYSEVSLNSIDILLLSLGIYLMVFGLLKGAEMPVRITFDESMVTIDKRFFFWVSTGKLSYDDIRITTNNNLRPLMVHWKASLVCFDALLWQKKQRLIIIQECRLHHVEISENKH